MTPTSGPAGTVIAIAGSGFGTKTNTSVKFSGTTSAPSAVTATLITVTVPAAATTGPITVTTPSSTLTTSLSFVVGSPAVPSISSFSPAAALAGAGLMISGGGFDPVNLKIFVNNSLAPALTATSSTLTSTVPTVSSGRIVVETPAGTGTSTSDFLVPPPGYATTTIAASTRAALGQTASLTIASSGSIGLILFDGMAGQRVSAIVTSSSLTSGSLCLYSVYNGQIGSCSSTAQTTYFPPQVLGTIGTYSLAAIPAAGVTGPISVALYDASDIVGTIVENGTFNGTVTAPGQIARVTFSGTAGDRIALAALLGGGLAGQYAYFQIISPDGSTAYNSGLTAGAALSGEVVLPTTGTYTILYQPSSSSAAGTVSFTLSRTVLGTTTIGTASAPLTIALAGQTTRTTFSGAAGDRIAMASLLGGGLSAQYAYFKILNPDGSTAYDSGLTVGSALSGELVLPTTGTYVITYRPWDGTATGTVTFTLSRTVIGTTTIGTAGTPLTIALAGQTTRTTFSGTAGDRIAMASLLGGGLSAQYAYFKILNPDGSTAYDSGLSVGSALSSELVLSTTGTYVITYRPWDGTATGSATFTVSRTLTGTTTIGGSAAAVTTLLAGQNVRVSFPGTAAQTATIGVSNSFGGQCYTVSVTAPDNSVVSSSGSTCTASYSTAVLTLPTSGTYQVLFAPAGFTTGNVTVTAQ